MIALYCACLAGASGLWAATLEVGSTAQTFRLQDQRDAWHEPNDYRGQWVVLYIIGPQGRIQREKQ